MSRDQGTGVKPDLILHPGLAKCGTSSIQKMFRLREHALPRALGCVWIGNRFRPFNGRAPVVEIMYHQAQCLEDIAAMTPDPATHFLSSEALIAGSPVMAALQERFTIARAVITIRLPLLQALSNYCFSGWITHPLEAVLAGDGPGAMLQTHDRVQRTLAAWITRVTPKLALCPMEAALFEQRFCRAAFGHAPPLVADLVAERGGIVNRSISPALAAALHGALAARPDIGVTGPFRAVLASAAQAEPEPAEFAAVLPAGLGALLADRAVIEAELSRYGAMLQAHGTDPAVIGDCLAALRDRLGRLAARPAPDAALTRWLGDHAAAIVARAAAERAPAG